MSEITRRALAPAALGALASLGLLAACGGRKGDAGPGPMFTVDHGLIAVPDKSPLRAHLTVAPVQAAGLAEGLQAPAVVETDPRGVANVLTPVTGRVLAVRVGLGDRVRKGQPLAVVASGDFAQANADVAKAEDALALARKALDRARGVREAGGAAVKDLEAAESAFVQAQAELERAQTRQRALSAGGRGGAGLVLSAPLSGTITALSAAPGAQVTDPTQPLMVVTNTDHLIVTAQVGERDAAAIAPGQPVELALTAFPGGALHGRVTSVNAVLEPDTRRRKVRIALADAPRALLPNMYGVATFTRTGPAAAHVAVPQSAVLMNNDSMSVLVEVRPWVFERRPVKLGDENERFIEVVSGLQAGDRVVTRGGILLND